MNMKPRKIFPKLRLNPPKEKINVYSSAPVNRGFYERNLMKAKTIYMDNCCESMKKHYKKKEDRKFNQLLNTYYQDYKRIHKILSKPIRKERERKTFDINQYELKKKNVSVLFFNYDLKFNEDNNFQFTDDLINSMFNGENNTLIKTTQIKNDYERRLHGNKKNKSKNNNFIDDDVDNYNDEYDNDNYDYENNNNNNNNNIGNQKIIELNKKYTIANPGSPSDKTETKLNKINDIKENPEEYDENIFYLNDDSIKDDNFLNFKTNIYLNNDYLPLFNEIIKSDFNNNYEAPIYEVPQSALKEEKDEKNKIKTENLQENKSDMKKKQSLNKYKGGELKRFKDMIVDNEYPGFEQLTNPYYQTNYIPPPCFPKMPEDEEEDENDEYGYEDFGFKEDDDNFINEDDNALILLSNQITNKDFPMFEHLIRNDYKGNYTPPVYKIPSHIQSEIKKEKEKEEEKKEMYEQNKKGNVGSDINQYNSGELKMLGNIIKDDKYPLFEQIVNPYYQSNYIPPDAFPKTERTEKENDTDMYGDGDFESHHGNQNEGEDEYNDFE